jgi:outer membrane protein OmpA-like peptidoglycan-associated protein
LASAASSFSNDNINSDDRFGIFINFNLNPHSADFHRLPGIPNCCPHFSSGFGAGFSFGALYELPVINDFYLGWRAGYSSIGAELSETERTSVILGQTLTQGEFEHVVDASIQSIGIEQHAGYSLFENFSLFAGVRAGYIISTYYEQSERITKPDGRATFLNPDGTDSHQTVRNESDGAIPEANSLNISALLGMSYALPLNSERTLTLNPELSYYLGFSDLVNFDNPEDGEGWKANSFKIGASIKYSPKKGPKYEYRENIRIDTVEKTAPYAGQMPKKSKTYRIGKPAISIDTNKTEKLIIITENYSRTDTLLNYQVMAELKVAAYGLTEDDEEIENPKIVIEEFTASHLEPLLNYIFFEEGSANIPDRYKLLKEGFIRRFTINDLYDLNTLQTYYHILNIIGRRMTDNPSARLELVGCNSNNGTEKNNIGLSQQRAINVKKYLSEKWDIATDRIEVRSRNLPKHPSTPLDQPEKIAENRRVEIYSDSYDILAPVFTSDTVYYSSPPEARFRIDFDKADNMNTGKLSVYLDKPRIKLLDTNLRITDQSIDWPIPGGFVLNNPDSPVLKYSASAFGPHKSSISDSGSLPVEVITLREKKIEKKGDKRIDRFRLILFGFDEAEIEGMNRRIMEFINSRLSEDSKIFIKGYTDKTGEEDYNKQLSMSRARNAAGAIDYGVEKINGIGESVLIFDNRLPEGRFYCRTVIIYAETPINQ